MTPFEKVDFRPLCAPGRKFNFTKIAYKKICPTLTRVHEVDFGSIGPIYDDKTIKCYAPKIFGSCCLAAGLSIRFLRINQILTY